MERKVIWRKMNCGYRTLLLFVILHYNSNDSLREHVTLSHMSQHQEVRQSLLSSFYPVIQCAPFIVHSPNQIIQDNIT